MTKYSSRKSALLAARNAVRDEIRKQGMKVSHFISTDITKAAMELMTKEPRRFSYPKK